MAKKDEKKTQNVKKGKDGATPKSAKGKKIPEQAIPPQSTTDPNAKLARRKSQGDIISSFQGQLDMTATEYEREQMKTIGKIRILRKDNERIQRKQEAEFGITLDMLDELKVTLDKTKASNQKLYEDMEEAKAIHDKLEEELNATKQRFNDAEAKIEEFQKDTKKWQDTKTKFAKSEARVRDLREANKKLRFILLNNHIDHTTDARTIRSAKRQEDNLSLKSNHTFPKLYTRQLTVKSRYDIAGEIDNLRHMNADELKKKYGITKANLDQMSPAYLGFYLKRKRRSVVYIDTLQNQPASEHHFSYRTGVRLPRVEARQYDRLTLE